MKLSIIVPVYNEARTVNDIVDRIQAVQYPIDYEIIIVDDASTDRTPEEAYLIKLRNKESHRVKYFKNKINSGKGFSIRKGIRRARGEVIIIQDADVEYDPQDIPYLLEPILKKETDVVYGSRFLKKIYPDGMAYPNWIANKILTKFTNIIYGLNITDLCTCYKVFRADIIKSLPLRANRFTFCAEVTALLAKRKIKIKELPISYSGRSAREGKKVKTRDFFSFILTLIWHRLNGRR
jgi:glycosyltransferase involved in cell wall biosynthesis